MKFRDCLQKYAQQAGFVLSEAQVTQLEQYYELLIETNKVMNLTAITEVREVVLKHILDSFYAYEPEIFNSGAKICDLGTGAGFPGVPLKVLQPTLDVVLMDSLAKRLKFLDQVIENLALQQIVTCHLRAEDAGRSKQHREQYDLVCSRAVARLQILAEYCLPLLKTGGVFVALKASNYQLEVEQAEAALKILGGKIIKIKQVQLPELEDKRVVIYIKKERSTAKTYPRKAGIPEKNPL